MFLQVLCEENLVLVEGEIAVVSPFYLDVTILSDANKYQNSKLSLEQSFLSRIRIPYTLVRNSASKRFQIGEKIFLKHINKDTISGQSVYVASTNQLDLDWKEDCAKNQNSFAKIGKRDQWKEHSHIDNGETKPYTDNDVQASCKIEDSKTVASLKVKLEKIKLPSPNEPSNKTEIKNAELSVNANEKMKPIEYLKGVDIAICKPVESYKPYYEYYEYDKINEKLEAQQQTILDLERNLETYIKSWFTIVGDNNLRTQELKNYIRDGLDYYKIANEFTLSRHRGEAYAKIHNLDENVCECMRLVDNLKYVLKHITIYHFILLHHYTAKLYMADYYPGLEDFFLPLHNAKKEYLSLQQQIVGYVRTELLSYHSPIVTERSAIIQEALDKGSTNVWEVFQYEKSQRESATLNDWIFFDSAIKNIFQSRGKNASLITSLAKRILAESDLLEVPNKELVVDESTILRQGLEMELFEITLNAFAENFNVSILEDSRYQSDDISKSIVNHPKDWLFPRDTVLCLAFKNYIKDYFALERQLKTLNCEWQNITTNASKIEGIHKRMNLIYQELKTLKNVVKFTRLENNRHFEELQFIRNHLMNISNIATLKPHGKSISIENQTREQNFQRPNLFGKLKDPECLNYVMSNGNDYSEFLSKPRINRMLDWNQKLKVRVKDSTYHLNKYIKNVMTNYNPDNIEGPSFSENGKLKELVNLTEKTNGDLNKLRKLSFAYVAYHEKYVN